MTTIALGPMKAPQGTTSALCLSLTEPSGGEVWKLWFLYPHLLPSGSLRACQTIETSRGVVLALMEAHLSEFTPGSGESGAGGHFFAFTGRPGGSPLKESGRCTTAEFAPEPNEEQVRLARETLSLNVAQIAEILGVSRQTVHAWQRGDSSPSDRNAEELARLAEVAHAWKRRSAMPLGRWLKTRFAGNGPSLFSALSSHQEIGTITSMLDGIAERVRARQEELRSEIESGVTPTTESERHIARTRLQRNRYFGR